MKTLFDTILFDAGGTLIMPDCDRVARILGSTNPAVAARMAQSWYRTIFAYDELLLITGKDWRGTPGDNLWTWFWNRMGEAVGLPPLTEEVSERLREENRARPLWDQANGEAHALLAHLHGNYRLGVVSNSDGSVADTLERVGLAKWFDVIVDSEVVGVSKPDPAIFDFALKPLKSDPARTVYIGDSYALDCVGAGRAGLYAILLDPHGLHTHRGVERVARLSDLCQRF